MTFINLGYLVGGILQFFYQMDYWTQNSSKDPVGGAVVYQSLYSVVHESLYSVVYLVFLVLLLLIVDCSVTVNFEFFTKIAPPSFCSACQMAHVRGIGFL